MQRRHLLAGLGAGLVSLAGCTGREGDDPTTTETPTTTDPEPTETPTPTSDPSILDVGTLLMSVLVEFGFSGEVVLEADCRDEEYVLEAGDRVELVREEDGESCPVRLLIDGEAAIDRTVQGYEEHAVTVTEDGEVRVETVLV
ncbi:MAG: hypothetical protein ACQEQY_02440 [Halobacteriota archaeon]